MITFYNISLLWCLLALLILPLTLLIKAPYGRHTTKGWGTLMDNKLGWIIMELPALLLVPFIFVVFNKGNYLQDFDGVFVLLWILHYFNRTIIFPSRIKTQGKKMPISIMASAFMFNCINGSIIGYYFASNEANDLNWAALFLGGTLFFTGLGINWWADNRLISLRKPGEKGYKIPYGGLFNRVSCPNLLGEIVEWLGFAIMTISLPTLGFFMWTVANLVPRALNHHQWYKSKFPEYPTERKAVFPFIL